MILSIRTGFSSAHFYFQPTWSAEENQKVFGSCYSKWGHGHNYTLDVGFSDPGEDIKRHQLKELILLLASHLDNKHLNYEIPEFKEVNPTTENLTAYFERKILASALNPTLRFIKVYEMESLGSELHYE